MGRAGSPESSSFGKRGRDVVQHSPLPEFRRGLKSGAASFHPGGSWCHLAQRVLGRKRTRRWPLWRDSLGSDRSSAGRVRAVSAGAELLRWEARPRSAAGAGGAEVTLRRLPDVSHPYSFGCFQELSGVTSPREGTTAASPRCRVRPGSAAFQIPGVPPGERGPRPCLGDAPKTSPRKSGVLTDFCAEGGAVLGDTCRGLLLPEIPNSQDPLPWVPARAGWGSQQILRECRGKEKREFSKELEINSK